MNINKWISALAALAVTSAIAIAAQQTIGVGTVPNDGTGDPLRTAFGKANDNFTELYARPQGTVTSIATACGVTGGTITTTGTIQGAITANAQTGTSYTPLATDCGKLVTISNASAIAITLTNANFSAGNFFEARVLPASVGAATFTPSSGTIDGGATLVLQPGQGTGLVFDGTNWLTMGQYTTGPSSSTAGNFPSFTGTGGQRLQDSGKAAPTGAVVGTTDSQTLTNKSIVATQLTGTVAAAQMPALTGDCTTSAGAVAVACPHMVSAYKSSNWYRSIGAVSSAANSSAGSNTVYCHPFVVSQQGMTVKGIGAAISTIAAGNVSFAIYKADGAAGYPSTLVDSISASQSTNATSASGTLTGGTDALLGGMYWVCSVYDNTTVRFLGPSVGAGNVFVQYIGASTIATAINSSATVIGLSCTAASTCGGSFVVFSGSAFTWFSLASATFTPLTNAFMPEVALQAN